MTNIGKNGIPYGVISANDLDPNLLDTLWYQTGTDLTYQQAWKEALDEAVREALDNAPGDLDDEDIPELVAVARAKFEDNPPEFYIEEPTIVGTYEGVKYEISWLGGAPLVFILESPYIGRYARCSPCVPGAGDLDNDGDYECYDVPPDWRCNDEDR